MKSSNKIDKTLGNKIIKIKAGTFRILSKYQATLESSVFLNTIADRFFNPY